MTISSSVSKTPTYACNGATFSFPYAFKILSASDMTVILEDAAGFQTTLVLNADYTLTGVGSDAGGSIVTTVAYAAGNKLTGIRSPSFLQGVDLQNQGAFFAQVIEEALDLAAMRDQKLQAALVNSIKAPETETVSMVLPSATVRANKYLLFDANGQPSYVDSQIDERYYGALSADPATRPDGSARQSGDTYFNTVSLGFRVYTGFGWQPAIPPAALTLANYTETATTAKTTFTIPGGYTLGTAFSYLNGVLLAPDEVSMANGTTAVLTTACAIGDEFRLVSYSPFSVADTLSRSSNLNDIPSKPLALVNLGLTAVASEINQLVGITGLVQTQIDNRLSANVDDKLEAGYTAARISDGSFSSGTYTPSATGANYRAVSNAGAFTLAAPATIDAATATSLSVLVTNVTGAGAITMTGFARVTGDAFSTTVGHAFLVFITMFGSSKLANVVALQ